MKRFLLFIFIAIFISVGGILIKKETTLNGLLSDVDCETDNYIYAESDLGYVLEEKNKGNSIKYISNGEVVGECVWLTGGEELLNKVSDRLGLLVTKKYYVDNNLIIEGVSSLLKYKLKNRQANIQISVDGNGIITVASPIIYGSY